MINTKHTREHFFEDEVCVNESEFETIKVIKLLQHTSEAIRQHANESIRLFFCTQ